MTPRRPAASSRDRMLDAAEALMREGGLAAAGIKQVAARGRAPIGSVYHHFPRGKAQLAAEALRRHGARARRLLETMFDRDAPVAARVRTLFGSAAREFDRSGRDRGCAIGAVTLDLTGTDEALRAVCQEAFAEWIDAIAERLPWRSRPLRRSFAEMVVTTLEGAFVLSRARRSGKPFLTAGEWLASAADAYETR
ncbi:MAG TPA: helix-turn-helix domain-containing protein [Vicinamibacterales bacterium]|nr:helix-turn-helix domain-containing protein [Vicinamibacterales bacterium]